MSTDRPSHDATPGRGLMQRLAAGRLENLQARLLELGVATAAQLDQARQEQAKSQERFSAILVRLGVFRDADSGKRLGVQLGWLAQRVDATAVPLAPVPAFPGEVCRTHRVIAIAEPPEERLLLATDDPLTLGAWPWLERRAGCPVDLALVREEDFKVLLARLDAPAAGAVTPAPLAQNKTASASAMPASAGRPAASAPVASPATATPSLAPLSAVLTPAAVLEQVPGALPKAATPKPVAAAAPSIPAAPPKPAVPAATPPVPAPASEASLSGPRPSSTGAVTAVDAAAASAVTSAGTGSDEPIIRLVDSLLGEAVRLRASDIHVEPLADKLRVRYRIDGVLQDVSSPPKPLQGPLTSRIKIMAGLNIAEKRHPQDGRLEVTGPPPFDVRISTLPALHGESIVMRLLSRSHAVVGLADLGMAEADRLQWEELIRRPYGMVLVTGPTGSGKTTTLYATLAFLNRPERKLITVEDPVEYQLPGVNQVSVKSAIGLTFAAGLRAMLRQAPDVIMIGEIRDQETAQIAVQAALTGHLVFSTLHTNDAPTAVTRLVDMGIAPFLVASTVQGVLAQRLIRRICPGCRTERDVASEELVFLGEPPATKVAEGQGCDACHGSGYHGRQGIYELFAMTDSLRHLVATKTQASGLRQQAAREGMHTLRDDGKRKVREGTTTMAEVIRATPETV